MKKPAISYGLGIPLNMVNILVRCCNPAMVNAAEGALHLAPVDDHIDVSML